MENLIPAPIYVLWWDARLVWDCGVPWWRVPAAVRAYRKLLSDHGVNPNPGNLPGDQTAGLEAALERFWEEYSPAYRRLRAWVGR